MDGTNFQILTIHSETKLVLKFHLIFGFWFNQPLTAYITHIIYAIKNAHSLFCWMYIIAKIQELNW